MAGSRGWALAAAAAVVLGAAGCGAEEGSETVMSIAIATPGPHNDVDWTRKGREAFETIVERRGMRGRIADGATAAEAPAVLEHLAADGTQLVIAHDPAYADAAIEMAHRTGVPVLVWGDRDMLEPGLVGVVEVDGEDAAYAAGVLTTEAAETRRLAVLIGDDGTDWDMRNWNAMAEGFAAAARETQARADVVVVRVPDATASTMHDRTMRLLRDGVQTVFTLAGESSVGPLDAIDARPGEQVYAGVIGDKITVSRRPHVITSVLYDFEWLWARALADLGDEHFGQRSYVLRFTGRGLSLLATGRTPNNAYEAAVSAQPRFRGG